MAEKEVKNIFDEIYKAIDETRSDYPVPIDESRFLKKLNQIRKKYLGE